MGKRHPIKALSNGVKSYFNVPEHKADPERLSPQNMIMFSLGTLGRDFVYNLFAGYLITYIMFTKTLTDAQFGIVTIIMVAARIFDAFNDPLMGGIVENTRSKWGKFKPWQFVGAILTGGVIIGVFSNNLQGDNFLILLGVLYFLFSITFTMNDISYWGMLPSLSSNEQDRSKITSFAQLVASAGSGLSGLLIPILTAGSAALGGSAVTGYMWISIISVILMIAFQMFTIFGVKEKPLSPLEVKQPRMTLKDMFKVLVKNDQLMWSTLIMLIFCVGTGVVNAGLLTNYIYFEFGYEGSYTIYFFAISSVASVLFTALYPKLVEKFTRTKLLYTTGFSMILGYALILIFGLAIPHGAPGTAFWYAKFVMLIISNGFVGFGQGFYMIMVLSMTNTVEYNEYKTGERKEGLILSLRPFTAKLSSAINQGLVYLVFLAANAFNITNRISEIERDAVNAGADFNKMELINQVMSEVTPQTITIILVCMCVIPIVFMGAALLIYKKKYILDDNKYAEICEIIKERRIEKEKENKETESIETNTNENVEIINKQDEIIDKQDNNIK